MVTQDVHAHIFDTEKEKESAKWGEESEGYPEDEQDDVMGFWDLDLKEVPGGPTGGIYPSYNYRCLEGTIKIYGKELRFEVFLPTAD